jgi:hypothetical protein
MQIGIGSAKLCQYQFDSGSLAPRHTGRGMHDLLFGSYTLLDAGTDRAGQNTWASRTIPTRLVGRAVLTTKTRREIFIECLPAVRKSPLVQMDKLQAKFL